MKKLYQFSFILLLQLFTFDFVNASTPTITSPQSDGGCYFADSSSSSQFTLLQNGGMSTSIITDQIKCSCATKPDSLGLATDIFVAKADGTIQTYFTGSSIGISTSSGFDTNKERCFRENTARFYNPSVRQCFNDLTSCKAATPTTTTTGTGTPQSDGGCFFAPPSSGNQNILLKNGGSSTSIITDEIKCSCATKPDTMGNLTDIFVAKPEGGITSYFSGSSIGTATSAGYITARDKCFRENTQRYYNKREGKCYSDLNSCKASNTAAAASSCTEADENKLFLVVPPATKTPIDAATEAAKKTSVLNCVKTGKTVTQCINTYFGAGPTSTVLSNDNFARCTCLYDSNGILGNVCTLTGTACTKVCSLKKEGFANFQTSKAVTPSSPLAFIKVLSDFLFWLAVIIFVINFLRAGLAYAQSKGDEGKLKEASAILTSTIGGIIFILLIGGLVRYILDTLGAAGLR
jgi:hypothetical protein